MFIKGIFSTGEERFSRTAVRLVAAWGWLFLWHLGYGYLDCPAALALLVPTVLFIMLAMTETALLRRRAFLNLYLRPDTWRAHLTELFDLEAYAAANRFVGFRDAGPSGPGWRACRLGTNDVVTVQFDSLPADTLAVQVMFGAGDKGASGSTRLQLQRGGELLAERTFAHAGLGRAAWRTLAFPGRLTGPAHW